MAQKGFFIGPAIGVGVNYSKNFIAEQESPYFIDNKMGLYGHGGLDIQYALDEYTQFHVGIAYRYKQYTLDPPGSPEGLSFETLSTSSSTISIPIMVHQRIPLGDSRKMWLNLGAGISIDLVQGDSTVALTPGSDVFLVDSGAAVQRHYIHHIKQTLPTPLLNVGLDFTMGNGSVLNIGAVWSPGTGQVVKGDIQEWESLNNSWEPANEQTPLPQQFPDHYFDFAMRGSTVSLRLAYWFNIGNPFEKKDPFGEEE